MRLMSHRPDSGPSPVKTRAMRGKKEGEEATSSAHEGQDLFVKTTQAALEEDLVSRKYAGFKNNSFYLETLF